jgi:hypothetical protein
MRLKPGSSDRDYATDQKLLSRSGRMKSEPDTLAGDGVTKGRNE